VSPLAIRGTFAGTPRYGQPQFPEGVVVRVDLDELVEHWTLLDDERELVAGKRGPTRLGFALILKFYSRHGRFPAGRSELPGEAVAFVAKQVKVPASDLGFYEWSGSTIEYHRNQVREHLGFRVCSVADADKLADWLAAHVAHAERNPTGSGRNCCGAAGRSGSSPRRRAGSPASCARRCTTQKRRGSTRSRPGAARPHPRGSWP
jgi:hypothetical protein